MRFDILLTNLSSQGIYPFGLFFPKASKYKLNNMIMFCLFEKIQISLYKIWEVGVHRTKIVIVDNLKNMNKKKNKKNKNIKPCYILKNFCGILYILFTTTIQH